MSEPEASLAREISPRAQETQRQVDEIFRARLAEGDEPFSSENPLSSKACVIAMLPRTGSTALSSLMTATGSLGEPDEYFNPRGPLPHFLHLYPAPDMDHYIDSVRRERQSRNGIFSVKTTFDDIAPYLEAGSLGRLLGPAEFVYLTREDLIEQAISSYRAEASGVWHRRQSGDLYRSDGRGDPDPPFDEARILRKLDELIYMGHQWERAFALYGIEPLRISYEEILADASAVVAGIASHLGVEWSGSVSLDSAVTAKLADEQSAEWAERIRSTHRL